MKNTIKTLKVHGLNILSALLVVFALFYGVFFKTSAINGASMEPTYASGDIVITRKTSENIASGDVITLNGNKMAESLGYETPNMIKRVVALPGDQVVIMDNVLYVNGEELVEDYVSESMNDSNDIAYDLKADEYFVLGDNRNHSTDSRSFGPVQKSWIEGRATIRVYSAK